MKFEDSNLYLNSMLRCMHGNATKNRIGMLPRFIINPLLQLNKSKFKFIGFFLFVILIFLKNMKKWMQFRLMPMLPKSIRDFLIFSGGAQKASKTYPNDINISNVPLNIK